MEHGDSREDPVLSDPKINKKKLNAFGNQRNLNCISLFLDEDKIVVNGAEISIQ